MDTAHIKATADIITEIIKQVGAIGVIAVGAYFTVKNAIMAQANKERLDRHAQKIDDLLIGSTPLLNAGTTTIINQPEKPVTSEPDANAGASG